MKLLEYLDRAGQRKLERDRLAPPRPRDSRMLVGVLFFSGYYLLVYQLLHHIIPAQNAALVRDAMLVLGPVIGAIGQALFRTDVRDEIATNNTGEAFRGFKASAEAAKAASETTPASADPKALRDGDTITLDKEKPAVEPDGLNKEIEP